VVENHYNIISLFAILAQNYQIVLFKNAMFKMLGGEGDKFFPYNYILKF